jgi:hypothetical protein
LETGSHFCAQAGLDWDSPILSFLL